MIAAGKKSLLVLFLIPWLFLPNLSAQPEKADTVWKEGIEFIMQGDYLMGIEKMSEYLQYHPWSAYAYNNRAYCKSFMGDMDGYCSDMDNAHMLGYGKKRQRSKSACDTAEVIKLLKKEYYPHTTIYSDEGYRPRYTRADSLRGALRPERNCYDVFFYNLTVSIYPYKRKIEGSNEIWFKGVSPGKVIQLDLFENYTIRRISMGNTELPYRREFQAIFVELPDTIKAGEKYKLTVEYYGKPERAENPPWQGGFVWTFDKHLNRWVSVACEYLGASSWWPVKDHLSDRPDSMGINIEVPHRFQAVCNGRLRNVKNVDRHYLRYEWFVDYPINNYNVTFYMGKYSEFTDTIPCGNDTVIARYDVMPYDLEKAKEYFRQAREVVSFYSSTFGPFPFPKDNFRMVESSYEGMEHQTAIAYGQAFNTKKNAVFYKNKEFDYIIVHEAAHEWWGNSVAASDMADIWIHEGFATYSEYLFIEHMLGYEQAMDEIHHRMAEIFNVWPLVQNHNVNENAFASEDVYTKGAMVLQCLRATMDNDTLFKTMLRDFNLQYRDSTIQSAAFIRFVNKYTNHDFTPFFNTFLYQSTIPLLKYFYSRQDGSLILRYQWIGVEEGFEMPFSIKVLSSGKAYRLLATTQVQEITIPEASSFLFYDQFIPVEGCPHNGLTYFRTTGGQNE
jgi:aminopeptidase N